MKNWLTQAGKLLIAAGIPTLIGITIVDNFLGSELLLAFMVGIAGLLTIGVILSLLASVFLRFPLSAGWATIAHFLLLLFTGMILMGLAYNLVKLVPQGKRSWCKSPPEKVVRFLRTSDSSSFGSILYIQAESGNIYIKECSTYNKCTWVKATSLPTPTDKDPGPGDCPSTYEPFPFIAPFTPAGVIDKYLILSCGADGEVQFWYLLLNDGRIFTWVEYYSTMAHLGGIIFFAFVGMIAGISTSIATLSLRKRGYQSKAA